MSAVRLAHGCHVARVGRAEPTNHRPSEPSRGVGTPVLARRVRGVAVTQPLLDREGVVARQAAIGLLKALKRIDPAHGVERPAITREVTR